MITDEKLARKMDEFRKYCSSVFLSSINNQDKVLRRIVSLTRKSSRSQMQMHEPDVLVHSIIKIIFTYSRSLTLVRVCEWKRRRRLQLARNSYSVILNVYIPEKRWEVTRAVVEALDREGLWEYEEFSIQIMKDLLDQGGSSSIMFHAIWDKIESHCKTDFNSRAILRSLCGLFDVYQWPETEGAQSVIERILKFFYFTIMQGKSACRSSWQAGDNNVSLRKPVEVCVRCMVNHLSNAQLLVVVYHMCSWVVKECMTEDMVFDFGSTLEYTAYMHQTVLYKNTLTSKIFPLLMKMIASHSRVISLLGNRVIQHLLDRQENKIQFNTPRIFFENVYFNIKISQCHKEDKTFFKNHRESIHDSLLTSIVSHGTTRMNLESSYCTICLIAVEIPCGLTAAALVCLAINIQDLIIERGSFQREVNYHIHASIMAIMSLLCWIHKAKVLYSYVNKIMMERAQWAPHLNPPIQSEYQFAVHHILWTKPELFFVDWEARYGLWKCFRLTES